MPVRSGGAHHATETTIGTAIGLLAVCLLIIATGVFVAAEFALVAADRTRIERRAGEGSRPARWARQLLRRLSFHLSGAQLGITIASLMLGFLAEPTIATLIRPVIEPLATDRAAHAIAVAAALVLATFLEMVLGELVPKNLAITKPEATAVALAPFLRLYGAVFGPLIRVLNGAANWTVRKLGIEPKEELSTVRTLPELALVIEASAEEGTIGGSASRLLRRSIRFTEKTAADVLIPRVEVRAVSRDATVSELVALAAETGHSRFPVTGADLDDIVGVVHVNRVHALPVSERDTTPVSALMSDVTVVPESRELQPLLVDMRARRQHLAVVVDEYGGTAGIVTMEDVLEEIVGEIDDEYDLLIPRLVPVPAPDGGLIVPGALHPDEVREATGFEMPEGDYETLAGFVLDRLGHLPEVGEVVSHEGWELEVVEMDRRRIVAVHLRCPPPAGSDPAGAVPGAAAVPGRRCDGAAGTASEEDGRR